MGERDFLGDVIRGAAAGMAGVWAMDRVDWFNYRRERPETRRQLRRVRPGGEDPAHVLAGRAERLAGVGVTRSQHEAAGLATHYAIGIAPAALFGVFKSRVAGVDAGRGLLYGLAMFLLEDELVNPLLGLAAGPMRYPWQAHARGLVAHLVYGFVTDLALNALAPRLPNARHADRRGR